MVEIKVFCKEIVRLHTAIMKNAEGPVSGVTFIYANNSAIM